MRPLIETFCGVRAKAKSSHEIYLKLGFIRNVNQGLCMNTIIACSVGRPKQVEADDKSVVNTQLGHQLDYRGVKGRRMTQTAL